MHTAASDVPQFRATDIEIFTGRTQREQVRLELQRDVTLLATALQTTPTVRVFYMLMPGMDTNETWQQRISEDFSANVFGGANDTPTGPTHALHQPITPAPATRWPPVLQQPQLTEQPQQAQEGATSRHCIG